jgi:hypothetical protein
VWRCLKAGRFRDPLQWRRPRRRRLGQCIGDAEVDGGSDSALETVLTTVGRISRVRPPRWIECGSVSAVEKNKGGGGSVSTILGPSPVKKNKAMASRSMQWRR